jgi:hypothetical protein
MKVQLPTEIADLHAYVDEHPAGIAPACGAVVDTNGGCDRPLSTLIRDGLRELMHLS